MKNKIKKYINGSSSLAITAVSADSFSLGEKVIAPILAILGVVVIVLIVRTFFHSTDDK